MALASIDGEIRASGLDFGLAPRKRRDNNRVPGGGEKGTFLISCLSHYTMLGFARLVGGMGFLSEPIGHQADPLAHHCHGKRCLTPFLLCLGLTIPCVLRLQQRISQDTGKAQCNFSWMLVSLDRSPTPSSCCALCLRSKYIKAKNSYRVCTTMTTRRIS